MTTLHTGGAATAPGTAPPSLGGISRPHPPLSPRRMCLPQPTSSSWLLPFLDKYTRVIDPWMHLAAHEPLRLLVVTRSTISGKERGLLDSCDSARDHSHQGIANGLEPSPGP